MSLHKILRRLDTADLPLIGEVSGRPDRVAWIDAGRGVIRIRPTNGGKRTYRVTLDDGRVVPVPRRGDQTRQTELREARNILRGGRA